MNILIIGGKVFLGRALVTAAVNRGHHVTLFNRGRSNPDLFSEVENLIGDRTGDLSILQNRKWDAVIDTCGYFPRIVDRSAQSLASFSGQYTFISSLSVYSSPVSVSSDETAPTGQLKNDDTDEITGETYGPLKRGCEQVVEKYFPESALIIRPGLIVGPHDPSDRFTYWPLRVARGGEVLAPGTPECGVQFIDVRDLADWTLLQIEQCRTGYYNVCSPGGIWNMGQVMQICQNVCQNKVKFTWIDDQFLLDQKVEPWMELPLWIPKSDPDAAGFYSFDVTKALKSGLTIRPLHETVRDTLNWARSRPADYHWRAGMQAERETEILRRYHTQ